MLASMLLFPTWALNWTGILLVSIYAAGMVGLVVLIEQSAPDHAPLRRLLPFFMRVSMPVAHEKVRTVVREAYTPVSSVALSLTDYYVFLGVHQSATQSEIGDAYLNKLVQVEGKDAELAERALATLTNPAKRQVYDIHLAESQADAIGSCCPPKRNKTSDVATRVNATPTRQTPVPLKNKKGQGDNNPARFTRTRHSPPAMQRGRREAPISWVGVVAAVITIALTGTWWLGTVTASQRNSSAGQRSVPALSLAQPVAGYSHNPDNLSEQQIRSLEAISTAPTVGADGKQTVNLAVSGDDRGYTPV